MDGLSVRYVRTAAGASVALGVVGSGPAVVWMPWSLAMSDFQNSPLTPFVKTLSDDFELHLYDHLGSGLSDRSSYDYRPAGFLSELEAVAASISGPISIVGWASTVPTAVTYAARNPERVACLALSGYISGSEYVQGRRFAAYRRGLETDWEMAAETFARVMRRLSGEAAERFAEFVQGATSLEAYRAFLDALPSHNASDMLSAVQCPTLVLWRPQNLFQPIEFGQHIAREIPNASLEVVGDDDEIFSRIHRFLLEHHIPQPSLAGSGTHFRTILFTDVVASTPLLTQLRDAKMREVMRGHDAVMEAAVTGHGGGW